VLPYRLAPGPATKSVQRGRRRQLGRESERGREKRTALGSGKSLENAIVRFFLPALLIFAIGSVAAPRIQVVRGDREIERVLCAVGSVAAEVREPTAVDELRP
jgi:hypothetical protein